jgi:hypothetical protein
LRLFLFPLLPPLYRLMVSRYCRGYAFQRSRLGWDFTSFSLPVVKESKFFSYRPLFYLSVFTVWIERIARSCYSPTVSGLTRRGNRLLVRIGRTFEPTRSGTDSSALASSHYAHASGQFLPLIRTLLEFLHHGSQARLRTFPDVLVDGGLCLPRFQVGQ